MRLSATANVPTEISLYGSGSYSDVFNEIEVGVIFKGPDGREWNVPAFWAGGTTFCARFAGPSPGRYTWRSVCSNEADSGLHDRSGELVVEPYEGDNPLYKHGKLRVADSHTTLEHADGTPFFWLGDTWWMGLTKRFRWPRDVRLLAADRVQKGFNVVQVVCGPLPDFDAEEAAWHPQQANEAGWSWEQGWKRINPGFYDLADLRIEHMVEAGLVPCIVGMWGYYLPFIGVENAKRHWRNLIARYGAYPVVWCVAGEAKMPTYSHFSTPNAWETEGAALAEGWTEVTRHVRETDPFRNPVTIHATGRNSARNMLLDDSLLDIDMLQTSHGGHAALSIPVEITLAANARQPRMPVINGEPSYEGIMGSSLQDVQRFIFWTSMTSCSAGHTYGAQGIWNMSSREEPFAGTTTSWGDVFWQDAMSLPGSEQVGVGRRLFERYEWWKFAPRREPEVEKLNRVSSFGTGIPGKVALFYLTGAWAEPRFAGVQSTRITLEPGARYRGYFYNPRAGVDVNVGEIAPDADGTWPTARKPSMEDWVLVLERAR